MDMTSDTGTGFAPHSRVLDFRFEPRACNSPFKVKIKSHLVAEKFKT